MIGPKIKTNWSSNVPHIPLRSPHSHSWIPCFTSAQIISASLVAVQIQSSRLTPEFKKRCRLPCWKTLCFRQTGVRNGHRLMTASTATIAWRCVSNSTGDGQYGADYAFLKNLRHHLSFQPTKRARVAGWALKARLALTLRREAALLRYLSLRKT